MEIFLLIAAKLLLVVSTGISMLQHYRICQRLDILKQRIEPMDALIGEIIKISEVTDQIQRTQKCLGDGSDRILATLKEIQESQKPKSTTNWDNLKEAFKGPARITINERD